LIYLKHPPEICPNCGTEVPRNARACPECGSDKETGWSDHAEAQRLGLPDDEFNYDEFVKEEFGATDQRREVRPRGFGWLWWIVAIVLIALLAWFFLGGFGR